ncbi:DJ-1/PfpI family protein [Methylobacter sp. Wu8]|uniref:DJ-1/PfpI family protein n=1 Tax=Methylobacter sp. Wu8 TaxID=3118457 RepID=UPI002F30B8DD
MDRRQFTKLALLGGGLAPLLPACQSLAKLQASPTAPAHLSKAEAEAMSRQAHEAFMGLNGDDFKMMGEEHIAMLLYPGFAALDLVGPQYLFASMMGAKIYLISPADDLKPVTSGEGLAIVPTHTRSECPETLDIFFVPGGANGTLEAMKNAKLIDFIARRAASSSYVTSVCTGSLLLGKAGLLKGKKATSHWTMLELLPEFGAIPVKQRVVWDGKLITGGGVTAGIDFGLQIVAALRGKTYAEAIQLQAEYDPVPPYDSGSPEKAEPFVRDNIKGIFSPLVEKFRLAI